MKITRVMPSSPPWTRTDEVRQRIGNCYRFLWFAWQSLVTDSTVLAVVMCNSMRAARDPLIAVTTRDGRRIDPDSIGEMPDQSARLN